MTLILTIFKVLAIILASFVFWRNLKEDYSDEEIFSVSILIFIFSFLGERVFSLQGAFLGAIFPLAFFSRIKKWDFWLAADALVFPLLIAGAAFNFQEPLKIFLLAIVGFLGWWAKENYRSFSWYKSGKVGFLICFSTLSFFSLFLILEIFIYKVLYLRIFIDLGIIGGAIFFLYLRSGRDIYQDRLNLLKKIKHG